MRLSLLFIFYLLGLAVLYPLGVLGQVPQGFGELPIARSNLSASEQEQLGRAIRAKDYSAVRQTLVTAIARQPKSHELWSMLGRIAFLTNHDQDALEAFQSGRKIAPLSQQDRLTLAFALQRNGDKTAARKELGALMEEFPSNAEYPYWTGRLEYSLQRFREALPLFGKAVKLNSGQTDPRLYLGLCLEALGKPDEALTHYLAAATQTAAAPKRSSEPALYAGAVLEKLGRLKEAENWLREAVRVPSAPAEYRLALVLEKVEKPDEALEHLRSATKLAPDYPEAWLALGRILKRRNQPEEAEKAIATFQKLKSAKSTGQKLQ
ncbi:MAG: tetratricopeptide repeat protein [Bryobacteraceae bacterium]|nr:tetratricopeptide repeat protein [Bryobacteraceae bacterium]